MGWAGKGGDEEEFIPIANNKWSPSGRRRRL